MMMKPVKSISVVYGIGKELAIPDENHDCAKCNLKIANLDLGQILMKSYLLNELNR